MTYYGVRIFKRIVRSLASRSFSTGIRTSSLASCREALHSPLIQNLTPIIKPGPGNVMARGVLGRLKAGMTMAQAQAESEAIIKNAQATAEHPPKGIGVSVVSLHQSMVGNVRPSLLILFGAVGFILLIACANVANLLLARLAGSEVSSPGIAGSNALASCAAVAHRKLASRARRRRIGFAHRFVAVPILLRLTPQGMLPRLAEVNVNAQVLGFTALLSMVTSLLFGIAPALQLSKARLAEFLKQGDRRLTGGQRLRSVLVASEIALSLVLLIGAGLMIKSFVRLRSVNPGFHPGHVVVLTVDLPQNSTRTTTQLIAYHQRVIDQLATLPGVVSAGAVNWLPLDRALIMGDFQAEGVAKKTTRFNVSKPDVTPDYFRTMGIQLLRGRSFDQHDAENSPAVVIVSQTVAKSVWGAGDPVGKRVTYDDGPNPTHWMTVVGVVDDVKQQSLSEKEPLPAIYRALSQVQHPYFLSHMAYAVRTTANPSATASLMRSRFRELDRNQPIQLTEAMDDLLDATTAEPRFYSRMLGAFSAIALLLASAGIYGVMAYSVAQRTREIGIRIALGAKARDIMRSVIGRSAVLITAGVAAGLAGAYGVTRVLERLLFDVKPTDSAPSRSFHGQPDRDGATLYPREACDVGGSDGSAAL